MSSREQDNEFAKRLGPMLVNLRREVGWSRDQAAEKLEMAPSTLGKWERGQNAPKAYDLSRLYLGYVKNGVPAEATWFLDPPLVVKLDPVRTRLDELRAQAADAAAAQAGEPAQRGDAGRATQPDRRSA